MRVLNGSKLAEAPPAWRQALLRDGRRVVIDLGAGDGRYAYECARRDPGGLYIAVDPDAAALSAYAYRAGRKPARGGVDNAAFVVAAVEQLPPELQRIAHLIRVNFAWGSLLRALLAPEPAALRAVASLARRGGRFEFVLSYDPAHDTGAFAGGPLPPPDETYFEAALEPAYAAAGLILESARPLSQEEALAIPSTWGRRLLHARPRAVYLLEGSVAIG